MAYYSGQASSYSELLVVLVNACKNHGWVWANLILSKNGCYIKLEAIVNGNATGIKATGGTGISGNTLINASPTMPRMGNPSSIVSIPPFPIFYHIFIFDDEVYFLTKFYTTYFHYLAFGKSNINLSTSGLWIAATSCGAGSYSSVTGGITVSPIGGGAGGASNPSAVLPFWNPNEYADNWSNATILHGLDDQMWSTGKKKALVPSALTPLHINQPSKSLESAILLPIQIFIDRPSNKVSLISELKHARFMRIDNYEPEQIIKFGSDSWMVFPFYKKNTVNRDGGGLIDHTGTFGWAIKYDGS